MKKRRIDFDNHDLKTVDKSNRAQMETASSQRIDSKTFDLRKKIITKAKMDRSQIRWNNLSQTVRRKSSLKNAHGFRPSTNMINFSNYLKSPKEQMLPTLDDTLSDWMIVHKNNMDAQSRQTER